MPDSSGRLTDKEIKKVEEWLRKRWPSTQECLVCGHSPLTIENHTVAMPTIADKGRANVGTAAPFITVLCDNCGYTHLFSAVTIGLFPEE